MRVSAMIHFGTDGWRARLDGDFTDDNVIRVAEAVGAYWARQAAGAIVYVGYDTRSGAERFACLAGRVLAGFGLVVKVCDRYAPAPALCWTVGRDPRAVGGLLVTGSHNPNDYQGIKLRMADGGIGTVDFYEEIERSINPSPADVRGPIERVDFLTPYFDHLYSLVDTQLIADAGLTIVYDPLYGAASRHFADLIRAMGIAVTEIHGEPDAETDRTHPEPVEPWVDDCEQAVVETGAMAGLVNDGDGDRVGAVDELGRFVSPQKIIALLLGYLVHERGMSGRVVLSLSSSALTRHVAEGLGCKLAIKPVGFAHIYSEIRKGDVLLGGEEAGGISVPAYMPERDGLFINLLLCELMAKTGKTLAELVDELEERFGRFSYMRSDLRVDPDVVEVLRTMLPGLNPPVVAGRVPVSVSHMDGLRLGFADDSWLLLRPSGTEPVVRVYAEAPSIELRDELLDAGSSIARGAFE